MLSNKSTPRPIVLLDICSISYIKDRKKIPLREDGRKKERLEQLSNLIESRKYRFSFLLAILEKGTDYINPLSADEMILAFKDDYQQIVDFIGQDNIVEPIEALEAMIPILMDEDYSKAERAELSIPASISLLEFYNNLKISKTPPPEDRLNLARAVAEEGERLKLSKGYPTITICVASIYGCIDARKILKIKEDGSCFNPSNRLGDIMSFYRVANAQYLISSNMPSAQVIFRTEDAGLEGMHSYLKTQVIGETDDGKLMHTTCQSPEKLFPELYRKGVCVDNNELNALYELLNFIV